MWHMKETLWRQRQEAVAERVYSHDVVPAYSAAVQGCRSMVDQASFARALVVGALWTTGRLVECTLLVGIDCEHIQAIAP